MPENPLSPAPAAIPTDGIGKTRLSRHWIMFLVATVVLSPLLYLAGGKEWLYPPPDWLDSHINLAFDFFLDDPTYHAGYYKAARVPLHIPRFLANALLGKETAWLVLKVAEWVAMGVLHFVFMRRLLGERRALLALPWVVFFPTLVGLGSGGGNYHNVGATLYWLAGLFCWAGPVTDRRALPCAAGALLASALLCNVILLNFIPFLPLIDSVLGRRMEKRPYAWMVVGALIAILAWGAANAAFGRPVFFSSSMLGLAIDFLREPSLQLTWWKPLSELLFSLWEGVYLSFFTMAALIGTIRLALLSAWPMGGKAKALTTAYVAWFALWIVWHVLGQTSLHPHHFLYPLHLPAFLMFASWLPEGEINRQEACWVVGTATVLWWVMRDTSGLQGWLMTRAPISFYLPLLLGAWAVAFCLRAFRSGKRCGIAAAAAMILCYAMFNPDSRSRSSQGCRFREESFKALIRMADQVASLEPMPSRVFVHGEPGPTQSPGSPCHPSIKVSSGTYARVLGNVAGYSLTQRMPPAHELERKHFRHLREGTLLVYFPPAPEVLPHAFLLKASDLGVSFREVHHSHERVLEASIPYYVYRVAGISR